MGEGNRDRHLLLRAPAAWALAGFCLFLIGAQLPYQEFCPPEAIRTAHDAPCLRWMLMDLTAEPGPNNDSWAVARWLAWLMPVLAATFLMRRAQLYRRQGAGFVTIAAIILLGRYLFAAMPPLFAGGAWEPGAALWPIGCGLMLIGAARARKEDPSPPERPEGIAWLRLLAFGILLMLAALWIDVDPAAYVFALGATALVTGTLILPPGRASARRLTHDWIRRLLAVPLLLGAVMTLVPTFAALGDQSGPTVRVEFLSTPERPDLWHALLMLAVVAGPVMAAIDVTRRGSVSPFSLGGATASVSWVFVPSIIAFFGPGDWFAPLRNAETNLILAGALLVWATLLLPLARQSGDPSDSHIRTAPGRPAVAAALVGAAVIIGVIAFMFQLPSRPDPCETWNREVHGRAQGYLGGREFLGNLRRTTVDLRAHVQEIRLELRDLADDRPDDCEIEEETAELLEDADL